MNYDYDYFMGEVLNITKIDLTSYKQNQMKRRIDALIVKHKIKDYKEYVGILRSDKEMLNEFVEYITINVSEFYRNPEQWKFLAEKVFPMLFERHGKNLKIWSAACSTGDEPYSLVMCLSQFMPLNQIKIIATDISDEILDKAKIGIYNKKSIVGVPKHLVDKYFTQNGDFYKVSDEIKSRVEFRKHNLLKDPFITDCDLIVCRNVLIYFTEDAKDKVFKQYYDCLKPGGVLFIGSTEQILNYKQIGYNRLESFFYEKEKK